MLTVNQPAHRLILLIILLHIIFHFGSRFLFYQVHPAFWTFAWLVLLDLWVHDASPMTRCRLLFAAHVHAFMLHPLPVMLHARHISHFRWLILGLHRSIARQPFIRLLNQLVSVQA